MPTAADDVRRPTAGRPGTQLELPAGRTVFVATTGGHLAEMLELADRLLPPDGGGRPLWITHESLQNGSVPPDHEVVTVPRVDPRDVPGLIRATRAARTHLAGVPVRAAFSTGSGVALAVLPQLAARGIECHYIESAARVTGPSMTGRLLQLVPTVRLWTQHPGWADARWRYLATIFDGYEAVERPVDTARQLDVVVTLGTMQNYGFERLVTRLREVLPDDATVTWQTGATDVGRDAPDRYLDPATLHDRMARADVVVAHAGVGSALGALRAGRSPILVPRRASWGEHVDDHQVQIADVLAARGLAQVVDASELSFADLVAAAGRAVVRGTGAAVPLDLSGRARPACTDGGRTRPASRLAATDPEADPDGAAVDVAYVVSDYPKISHAFIQREVLALRDRASRVDTYTVRRAARSELLTALDRAEDARTTALRPTSAARVAGAHLRALRRSPRGYLDTLRHAVDQRPPGARAAVWQVFYFATAVLLHERLVRRSARHVHAHLANNGADVAWLAVELGNRTGTGPWTWSFTMHGPTEFREVTRFNLRRKVEAADAVVCISDFCRSQLMALVGTEHWPKLRIVHCGVDLARYAVVAREGRTTCTVLDVGRLVPEKGHSVLVQAVELLQRRGVAVDLLIAGDGEERASLAALAERLGIADRVTLVGSVGQDAMAELYATADVFCLPSFAEGVPVVLMEAMATGLPVVTTPIAGIPELVEHDRNGVLVPPGRADLLADALAALAADPLRRAELGRAARSTVETSFDVATEVGALVELFSGR